MNKKIRQFNKNQVWNFINALDQTRTDEYEMVLREYYDKDAIFKVFHPFNTIEGVSESVVKFWNPLKKAIPDLERRVDIFAGDVYKDAYWVTCMGHICGTFAHSWIGIPPTESLVYLRMGEFHKVKDGKIVKSHILLDIPDLMRQAGVYPFRPMPAAPGLVPGPKRHDGIRIEEDDPEQKTLETVLNMHKALHDFDGKDINSMHHSHYWSKNFFYFAPAGIGTTRGMESFKKHHQQPFLSSFPDRHGKDHYTRISDGPIACTSHWGTLTATHTGSRWLGLPATDKKLKMRVADWYCLNDEGLIHENWLMMDILDIYHQLGLDVLGEI